MPFLTRHVPGVPDHSKPLEEPLVPLTDHTSIRYPSFTLTSVLQVQEDESDEVWEDDQPRQQPHNSDDGPIGESASEEFMSKFTTSY